MPEPDKPTLSTTTLATTTLAEETTFSLAEFRERFVRVFGVVVAIVAAIIAAILSSSGAPTVVVGLLALVVLSSGGASLLAHRGAGRAAVHSLVGGIAAASAILLLASAEAFVYATVAVNLLTLCAVLCAFLTTPRINQYFGAFSVVVLVAATGARMMRAPEQTTALALGASDLLLFIVIWAAATQVSVHLRSGQTALRQRLADIDLVVERARRVATGDLSTDLAADDELAIVLHEMLAGLREIVREVQESLQILAAATTNMDSMATQQQRGAVHQSSAVSETRETVQSFAQSSYKIAEAAEGVLNNATSTQKTNERANGQLNALASHTRRINELLEFVKDISSKSEILALNAALEGTKAGEAGRGFSLVAAQMQRLAESTANTIKDVKALTTDITKSTSATVISMEEATKLARDTTLAAQQITLITQQQSSGAEQVLEAMADIATVTEELAEGTLDTQRAIAELKSLSDRLNEVAHRFVL